MQELRLVAVSEDGTYLVLASAGRGTRFMLPVDDSLRAAARGQFSRLGQYEIEVESPLRPKEIQARIRAGETAETIAQVAGIPLERVRWFEGPVLQEREYVAQQAQRVPMRRADGGGPGPQLGEIVAERLGRRGVDSEEAEWDSWKREDGTWRVRLAFQQAGESRLAEWIYDPRRRLVQALDDDAHMLSSPEAVDTAATEELIGTVTPFVPRLQSVPEPPATEAPAPPPMPRAPEPEARPRQQPAEAAPEPAAAQRPEPVPGHAAEPTRQAEPAPAAESVRPAEPAAPADTGYAHEAEAVRDAGAVREEPPARAAKPRAEQTEIPTGPQPSPAEPERPAAAPPAAAQDPAPRPEPTAPAASDGTSRAEPASPDGGSARPETAAPAASGGRSAHPEPAAPAASSGKSAPAPSGGKSGRKKQGRKDRPAERPAAAAQPPEEQPKVAAAGGGNGATQQPPAQPRRGGRKGRRASVPSWDEIMFGAKRED